MPCSALQAFVRTPDLLLHFVRLKCDYLLSRCMERGKTAEEERITAFKVVKVRDGREKARVS